MALTDRSLTDEELLRQFLTHRDTEAFEGLVDRYQRFAYRVAYSVCSREAIAEEAVQEAFVRLARSYGRIQAEKIPVFHSWFFALVVNTTRYVLRTEHRKDRRERRFMEQHGQKYSEAPDDNSARHEQQDRNRAALLAALASLGDEMRIPIVLHYLEGVKQCDICTLFGVSQSQISRRIAQGLELLRKRLAGSGVVVPMAVLTELLQDQRLIPYLDNGSLAQAAREILSCPPGAEASAKWAAATSSRTAVLGIAGAAATVAAVSACVLFLPPRVKAEPSAGSARLTAQAPSSEGVARRERFKGVWSCETPESLRGIEVVYGHMEFLPGRGKNGKGCMQAGPDKTKMIFKVPHAAQPLRVSYRFSPDNTASFGVYWNKYLGWGVAAFQDLASPQVKHSEDWFKHDVYVSDNHMDYYTEGKRTAFSFVSESQTDELCICVTGQARISSIVIESVDPAEVPDYRVLKEAFDRIPHDARRGRVAVPGITPENSSRQASIEFSGPVTLDTWKSSDLSYGRP